MDLWLPGYLAHKRRNPSRDRTTHILLAVCDHYEPWHQATRGQQEALQRLSRWQDAYPKVQSVARDSDGLPPVHTFFFPVEQYDNLVVAELAKLCSSGAGEVEIHLHHDHDNALTLRDQLVRGRDHLAEHGLLSVGPEGLVYGFIHGNWALCNSHPEGRFCGVNNELSVLRNTGCYADFTMPSAPDRCQSKKVNSVYYARDTGTPRAHDFGNPVRTGLNSPKDCLLMVQGPLNLNWKRRKAGVLPRLENGDLTEANPPNFDRFQLWLQSNIHVEGRPDWLFVKLHTHGCKPSNMNMLLGGELQEFYEQLASYCSQKDGLAIHFVTAREIVNIILAAEAGEEGDPGQYRDYRYKLRTVR